MNEMTRKRILEILNNMETEPLPSEVLEQLHYDVIAEDANIIYNFILKEIKEREFEATQTLTRREETLIHQAVLLKIDMLKINRRQAHNTGIRKAFEKDLQEYMRMEEKIILRME